MIENVAYSLCFHPFLTELSFFFLSYAALDTN